MFLDPFKFEFHSCIVGLFCCLSPLNPGSEDVYVGSFLWKPCAVEVGFNLGV